MKALKNFSREENKLPSWENIFSLVRKKYRCFGPFFIVVK